jgi:hypothetical protein
MLFEQEDLLRPNNNGFVYEYNPANGSVVGVKACKMLSDYKKYDINIDRQRRDDFKLAVDEDEEQDLVRTRVDLPDADPVGFLVKEATKSVEQCREIGESFLKGTIRRPVTGFIPRCRLEGDRLF